MKTLAARMAACALFATLFATAAAPAAAHERTLFITSATEHADDTATFPLYRGRHGNTDVWYIVLDSSDGKDAERRGVNHSQKLANVRGTQAAQKVSVDANGVVQFPATVDFSFQRRVIPGPAGFPPSLADPGAVGEIGYSPLIQLPNGVILNAPHIANFTGQAAKVRGMDLGTYTVRMELTRGFQGGRGVLYLSTDASDPAVAALENVTFAPQLKFAPRAGGDGTDSARASLAAFVNGQTGAANPQRQGLNSALLDGLSPLNVLFWNPKQGRYSPLWDVYPAQWSANAVATGRNLRQTDFGQVENLAQDGRITGPDGARFAAADFVVNCPIVSRD
ncbi:MAG TPA: hypothetical protein VFM98_13600 [Ramlibacter sp.]|uniref:hypothetical protein n=1 Tax=Ramlibacter sp. TaxID=1917967 RepID=UPI002D7F3C35|nr:hypothetical protein [Ramlibacter sp.]HET8746636.1 hypothetical protein [Ramlibacter sp.]